jgi:chromate transporter
MDSILSMARPALKDWRGVLLAAVAAAALLLGAGALLVLLGSALAATLLMWGLKPPEGKEPRGGEAASLSQRWKTIATILLVAMIFAGAVALSGAWNPVLPPLALTMAKVDMLAFGGGYTAIALMHDQVVKVHPWLTSQEFLDGLALGQITPGPVMITATFVGYKVAGIAGALAATAGIFLPSWLLLALLAPQFQRMRSLVLVHRMVRGLLAAFVAMLVYVLWQVAQAAVGDWRGWLLTAAALAALRAKIPPLWVVGAGIIVSAILFR